MTKYIDLNITYIGSHLSVSNTKLTTLEGCPEHITGQFDCEYNGLTTLVGGPQQVDGYYYCSRNQLTDLEGCASHIGDTLYARHNDITSLVGIHKIIKSCNRIFIDSSDIKEGGIGLLLIANLAHISDEAEPFVIIKKYLGSGTKGMMKCRAELIANGYTQYAKL